MDYIKQKHRKLNHIIKNCKATQIQLTHFKNTLQNQIHLTQFNPFHQYHIKPVKSVSLLKSSRIHLDQFQKRLVKMTSFDQAIYFKHTPQTEHKSNKESQRRFKKIETCPKGSETQTTKQSQPFYQNQTQPVTPSTSKQKEQNKKNYLPNLECAYIQTFSPKNASLSQYSLAVKQLQRSVHKKEHEERCKKYNKQNILREYENRQQHKNEQLQMHRLNILKKISCENVKKYLVNKVQVKGKYASIERQQMALYRSYHERA